MDIAVRQTETGFAADWGAGPRRCAVGRSGIGMKQREGDGITPLGRWPLRRVLYRADRLATAPKTILPVEKIESDDAWCDIPHDPNYNRLVRLPYATLDERLWRDDHAYDVVVVVGFNDAPVVQGKGSAIFMHVASAEYKPTAGCVAFTTTDLLEAVAQLRRGDRLIVAG
ncbi:MAG TPA: L,D-transpeptidase family protein [Micropepsaceae bacterium]|nr:L,D-transpeptidase family protein [Micropepsaceae bacterium]